MDNFLGIISATELETLRRAQRDGHVHPVVNIAVSDHGAEESALTAWNTKSAAGLIATKDFQWLNSLHPRLTATDDFTHAQRPR